jgi:hypothetical protein
MKIKMFLSGIPWPCALSTKCVALPIRYQWDSAHSPEDATRFVHDAKKSGYDFIKVYDGLTRHLKNQVASGYNIFLFLAKDSSTHPIQFDPSPT